MSPEVDAASSSVIYSRGLLTINPFALSASASFSSGRGDSTTYTNGRIAAADNVYLTAGRDVNLIGGVVAGHRNASVAGSIPALWSVQRSYDRIALHGSRLRQFRADDLR